MSIVIVFLVLLVLLGGGWKANSRALQEWTQADPENADTTQADDGRDWYQQAEAAAVREGIERVSMDRYREE